jgi:hypothetical protein
MLRRSDLEFAPADRKTAAMFKSISLALIFLTTLAAPVLAEPPADLDACIALSNQTAKSAGAKIKSEAEFVKYHMKKLDLDSACGLKDFVGAEKIANEIRATFHLD